MTLDKLRAWLHGERCEHPRKVLIAALDVVAAARKVRDSHRRYPTYPRRASIEELGIAVDAFEAALVSGP